MAGSEYSKEKEGPSDRNQTNFNVEFKCQVMGELMSAESPATKLFRKYSIISSLQYYRG